MVLFHAVVSTYLRMRGTATQKPLRTHHTKVPVPLLPLLTGQDRRETAARERQKRTFDEFISIYTSQVEDDDRLDSFVCVIPPVYYLV
jgi:hypothetical protein